MPDTAPVLVTGPTGTVGWHVVAGLLERGRAVRALVRDAGRAGLPPDVEAVRGDLLDPGTVERAAKGVTTVFLLWPFHSADGAAEVVEAVARHASRACVGAHFRPAVEPPRAREDREIPFARAEACLL